MVFLSIGLPGRFSAWCERLLARLAARTGGTVATSVWPSFEQLLSIWPLPPSLEEIALTLIRDAPAHLVVGLHHPDERLLAIAATGAPFIVALDDPRVAACDIIAQSGAELGLVTRAVANCCPLMTRFAALPAALRLTAKEAAADIAATVAAVAGHFGLAIGRDELAMLAAELDDEDFAGEPSSAALPNGTWPVIDGALAAYAEQFNGGGDFGQIVWQRALFILNGEGFQRPTGLIEVAGAARTLLTGPFIQLPAGRWTARIVFGVSADAAPNTFFVHAVADGRLIGQAMLSPQTGGVFAADLDFSLDEQSAKGLELPLSVGNPCVRGQLAFGRVLLQPLAMRQADAFSGAADFESVLEL